MFIMFIIFIIYIMNIMFIRFKKGLAPFLCLFYFLEP